MVEAESLALFPPHSPVLQPGTGHTPLEIWELSAHLRHQVLRNFIHDPLGQRP